MCEYSMGGLPDRLAVQGEQLVVHRFSTNSVGLTSPADLWPRRRLLSRLGSWINAAKPEPECAVCIPPGTRLLLRDIPDHLQRELGIRAVEEVMFVQVSAPAHNYRDAVRFRNGQEVLLQRLQEGQRVEVILLSSVPTIEEEAQQEARKATVYLNAVAME